MPRKKKKIKKRQKNPKDQKDPFFWIGQGHLYEPTKKEIRK